MRAALFLLLALAACGPRYEIQRTLTPPTTANGPTCVAQCETTQEICRGNVDSDVRFCERQEDRDRRRYERCLAVRGSTPPGADVPRCFLPRARFCRPDYDECRVAFNTCYERCGGQVQETRVCVANC